MAQVKIETSWKEMLKEEFDRPYFETLINFLKDEKAAGKTIYPPGPLIFNAFELTPFNEVKVVILGQDPYHNPGEAMGLSFSVPKGVRIPPSLQYIYKEIHADVGLPIPAYGDLTYWAEQGVFLLNAMLTVEKGKAASHQTIGWQNFTDAAICKLSEKKEEIIFMLWGNFAKRKKAFIDENKHIILEAAHPSPLAGNAFSGCKHFSKTNNYLKIQGKKEIDWGVK